MERAAVLSQDNNLNLGEWFQEVRPKSFLDSLPVQDRLTLDELQCRYITSILKKTKGRIRGKDGAAQILEIKPTTLEARMRKLGINKYNILD